MSTFLPRVFLQAFSVCVKTMMSMPSGTFQKVGNAKDRWVALPTLERYIFSPFVHPCRDVGTLQLPPRARVSAHVSVECIFGLV